MTTNEMALEIGKPYLTPLSIIQIIFVFVFISSPFFWIWATWDIAWRVALTGILGAVIINYLYNAVKKGFVDTIENILKKPEPTGVKTRFQQRIDELKESRK